MNKNDIANIAIADHSGQWVSDIDSAPGRTAEAIRNLWTPTVELALAQHPWRFSRGTWRNQPAVPAADNPDPDMPYAFRLPADCVRVYELRPVGEFTEWEGFIACTSPIVTLIGNRRGVDIGRWSAFFCDYVGHYLAWRICTPISASEAIRKRCKDDMEKALLDAKADNGRAGTVRPVGSDSFMNGRTAGGWR